MLTVIVHCAVVTFGCFQISEMDFHDSALMVGFSEAMIKELQQVRGLCSVIIESCNNEFLCVHCQMRTTCVRKCALRLVHVPSSLCRSTGVLGEPEGDQRDHFGDIHGPPSLSGPGVEVGCTGGVFQVD